jgi:drug/metabolite transporter superfamily protein YnfA
MKSIAWYGIAALGEIAGCFAFWAWLRMQKSPWWIRGPSSERTDLYDKGFGVSR